MVNTESKIGFSFSSNGQDQDFTGDGVVSDEIGLARDVEHDFTLASVPVDPDSNKHNGSLQNKSKESDGTFSGAVGNKGWTDSRWVTMFFTGIKQINSERCREIHSTWILTSNKMHLFKLIVYLFVINKFVIIAVCI